MAVLNEHLIRQVFDEMVKYRPALSKYLIPDEDDEDDEIDYRILGDQIIKTFPWPIGIELRRLFSGSMRNLDRMRLDQIFKTIERTCQFISFVMISQVWHDIKENKILLSESVKKEFQSRFSVLTMGTYTWVIRMLGKVYSESNVEWFIPEMKEKLNSKFFTDLDFWVPERNDIGHYQINLSQEEIEKRCVEYEDKLTRILINLAFISKYRLVSVKDIRVNKTKSRDARFHHVLDLLNSSDSDFKAKEFEEIDFTDSRSVLLMKSIKSLGEYLNLSPLIIDTNSETIDTKDKFSIKKDIFLYTKFRNDHLMYLGTEVTEKCDLRTLSNYDILLEEYKEMISIICS